MGATAVSDKCAESFNRTIEDNLKVIMSYPSGEASKYLWKIGSTRPAPLEMTSFPVVVTAMDKDYYPFSQGMFLTLHKGLMKYNKNRVVVYDLGMTTRQRNVVNIAFAFQIYEHVGISELRT